MKHQSSRTMSISHSDFFRLLPRALVGRDYQVTPPEATVEIAGGTLTISLGEEVMQTFGSLKLPSTVVQFEFDGGSEEDRQAFFEQFELSFRRGGG